MSQPQSRLRAVNLLLSDGSDYVERVHRHHKPPQGYRFALGAVDDANILRGVAIVGRPVARMIDQRRVVEVIRLASDEAANVPSFLYGAAARAAQALAYDRIITYILQSEPGTSLRAVGWAEEADTAGGGSWDRAGRSRTDKAPTETKRRFGRVINQCVDWQFSDGWRPERFMECPYSSDARVKADTADRLRLTRCEADDVARYAAAFFPSIKYGTQKDYKFFLGAVDATGTLRGVIQVGAAKGREKRRVANVSHLFIQGGPSPAAQPLRVLKYLLTAAVNAAKALALDALLCDDMGSDAIEGMLRGLGFARELGGDSGRWVRHLSACVAWRDAFGWRPDDLKECESKN